MTKTTGTTPSNLPSTRFARLVDTFETPEGLADETLAHIEALESTQGADAHDTPPIWKRPLTRRAFVGAGGLAAACASVVLVARHLPSDSGSVSTSDQQESRNPFGLKVALAHDGSSSSAPLSPTAAGMTPISTSNGLSVLFRLNFAASGDNVDSITYEIDSAPSIQCGEDRGAETIVKAGLSFRPFDPQSFNGDASTLWTGEATTQSFTCAAETVDPPFLLEACIPPDDFWSTDETLAAYRTYRDLLDRAAENALDAVKALPFASSETLAEAARDADPDLDRRLRDARSVVDDLLAQKMRSYDEFLAWMRDCYATYLSLAGQVLDASTLSLTAAFADGATACRRYRISPMPDIEEQARRHFDALVDQNGFVFIDGEGIFAAGGARVQVDVDAGSLPFWHFADGELTEETAAAHDCEPLFCIGEA